MRTAIRTWFPANHPESVKRLAESAVRAEEWERLHPFLREAKPSCECAVVAFRKLDGGREDYRNVREAAKKLGVGCAYNITHAMNNEARSCAKRIWRTLAEQEKLEAAEVESKSIRGTLRGEHIRGMKLHAQQDTRMKRDGEMFFAEESDTYMPRVYHISGRHG